MGWFNSIRRRSYEILLEHCPEKANWDYVKEIEADIPRKYGDKVIIAMSSVNANIRQLLCLAR